MSAPSGAAQVREGLPSRKAQPQHGRHATCPWGAPGHPPLMLRALNGVICVFPVEWPISHPVPRALEEAARETRRHGSDFQ